MSLLKVETVHGNRHMKSTKVSFSPSKGTLIPNSTFYEQRRKDELKTLWYSREELMDSCNEAKDIVRLIHTVGGKFEEIDHSQHCVVGLEKYHGKKERETYRKLLIRSVLIRQEMNRGLGLGTDENECLSEISQMMSSSFKDFALWQAAMHEFQAHGKSQPSHSLLLQHRQRMEREANSPTPATNHDTITNTKSAPVSNLYCDPQRPSEGAPDAPHTVALVAVESGKRRRMMIDTGTFPIVRASDPTDSPCNTSARLLCVDPNQHTAARRTEPPQLSSQHGTTQRIESNPMPMLYQENELHNLHHPTR